MSPVPLRGVVLAAGLSTRMGSLKPLLPLHGVPALRHSVDGFLQIGVSPVVVFGHEADQVARALRGVAGVRCVINEEYRTGMWSSVLCGLRAAGAEPSASAAPWIAVLPADCALVRAETIGLLAREAVAADADVVYPTVSGERGHPPLLSPSLVAEALRASPTGGLREVLAAPGVRAAEVPVDDEGTLLDMDTPDQYRRMSELAMREAVPSRVQCAQLQEQHGVSPAVRAHCAAVARVAVAIAQRLNDHGLCLHAELLAAAALLHDVSRGEENHALAGARALTRAGYPRLAPLVADHMELSRPPAVLPGETEVLYLADKMVKDDRVVPLEVRFGASFRRFAADAVAREAVWRRFASASFIARRVEEITGWCVRDLTRWRDAM